MKRKFEALDEKKLVYELLSGSSKALGKFYLYYSSRIKRFVILKVRSEEDAEEIMQDTLLSALDSLVLFSRKSSLFTWLCGIARHEIADYYRKKRLKTVVFSKMPAFMQFVSKALEPDAKMMRKEYEKKVKMALGSLMPHYRKVLELKYMDGMSVKEIAESMGMSFKACESTIYRARKAFEVRYEELEI